MTHLPSLFQECEHPRFLDVVESVETRTATGISPVPGRGPSFFREKSERRRARGVLRSDVVRERTRYTRTKRDHAVRGSPVRVGRKEGGRERDPARTLALSRDRTVTIGTATAPCCPGTRSRKVVSYYPIPGSEHPVTALIRIAHAAVDCARARPRRRRSAASTVATWRRGKKKKKKKKTKIRYLPPLPRH